MTSSRSVSPGAHDALEAAVVDPGEQPDPVAEPGLLGDVNRHRLGERLHLEHPGHHRQTREVALEIPLAGGHALDPDDPLGLRVVLDDPVDEQERPAMRDQRLDLACRVDGFGHGQLLVGWRSLSGAEASSCAEMCAGMHVVTRGAPAVTSRPHDATGLTIAPPRRGRRHSRPGRAGSSSCGPRGTPRWPAVPGGSRCW